MNIIHIKETKSTNLLLMESAADFDGITVAVAGYQSAGKGMGTNTWESERDKNLLFSILVHPTFLSPRRQYLLSMTEALAVCGAVKAVLSADGSSEDVTIKWPNDIYVGDRKLSGTRIDLNINTDGIKDMVIGTGINVNQKVFTSDAPNPVSLWQITGREHSADALLDDILARFETLYALLESGGESEISDRYHECLYRRTGFHAYADGGGRFDAELIGVQPDGIMRLRRTDGTVSEYEFKEVKFII